VTVAFIGEIRIFPFGFAPAGWLPCDGRILSASDRTYMPLYMVIGTSFGGGGNLNFALPNLQGAVAVGAGERPGYSTYAMGQSGGAAAVALTAGQNGIHGHAFNVDQEAASQSSPVNGLFMEGRLAEGGQVAAYAEMVPDAALCEATIAPAGGGQTHNNMMPFLTLNFCIAYQGVFLQPG
jgi:microcystin-dependent protein